MFRRIALDTSLYIDWLNRRSREDLVVGPGYVRYLSAVVLMELRAGARAGRPARALDHLARAYEANRRLLGPTNHVFDDAGAVLFRLARRGLDTRRASLVHDVLIALTCRALGLTLYTTNATDFQAIRGIRDFKLEIVR